MSMYKDSGHLTHLVTRIDVPGYDSSSSSSHDRDTHTHTHTYTQKLGVYKPQRPCILAIVKDCAPGFISKQISQPYIDKYTYTYIQTYIEKRTRTVFIHCTTYNVRRTQTHVSIYK